MGDKVATLQRGSQLTLDGLATNVQHTLLVALLLLPRLLLLALFSWQELVWGNGAWEDVDSDSSRIERPMQSAAREISVEGRSPALVSESRRRLRRSEHLPSLRLQDDLLREAKSPRGRRRSLRRSILHLLDPHSHPPHQVRFHRLIGRRQRRSLQPNQQEEDEKLSSYRVDSREETRLSSTIKELFNKHPFFRHGLLIVVLFGTCMAIGDAVLTPTISVLSAVSGVRVKLTHLHENYEVAISCMILVGLFSLQHFGTHRVAFVFAPIVAVWSLAICSIGVYNIARWNPGVFRAISPSYLVRFLRATGAQGWASLAGVVLCITALGHFTPASIKMTFSFLVYPCLVLAYMGEAAFLSKHHDDIQRSFYKAVPEAVFWPVFVVATSVAVVGSQAAISAAFSIVSQCCALNCFPRVKIIHTSNKIYGQVYIPEINWLLLALSLAVTLGLRDTNKIGYAYGLAVSVVMIVTTGLMSLVMIMVWKQKAAWAVLFAATFGSAELLYVSACAAKVPAGGWIPLTLCLIFMVITFVWHYGTLKKHKFDHENKVSAQRILAMGPGLGMVRVPGIGLVYADLVTGLPAIFGHLAANLPAFHQVLVFVCVKSAPVPRVRAEERFLLARLGPPEFHVFRCVVRYGYRDVHHQDSHDFEAQLVARLLAFVEDGGREEAIEIVKAREAGVAYILGRSHAVATKSSSLAKKIAINVIFAFLSRNCRGPEVVLNVPYSSVLEVGMVYYI
ncbi:potassium transporter 1 isoform X2 [Wolffia australiana]